MKSIVARRRSFRRRLIVVLAVLAVLGASLADLPSALAGRPRAVGAQSTGLVVPADAPPPGLDTGVSVWDGAVVSLVATGSGSYGNDGGNCTGTPTTDPEGNRTLNGTSCGPKLDPNALDPSAPIGSLVGSIGGGAWFLIGSNWVGALGSNGPGGGQTGELNLAYNDDYVNGDSSAYSNNTGSFDVVISVTLPVSAVADPPGIDTGITISPAESYAVSASGEAGYGFDGTPCTGNPMTDPDGNRTINGTSCGPPKIDPSATLGTSPIGELIGQVAAQPVDGQWFAVGSSFQTTSTDQIPGQLWLLYNDAGNSDNTGEYQVTVTIAGSGGPGPSQGSNLGAPPVVTSAAYTGTDSTGGHFVDVKGSGLADAETVIYGAIADPTELPAPCPETAGTLTAVSGPCSYAITPDDQVTGSGGQVSDTALNLTTPPQADLAHVMIVSPWGRSESFSVSGLPVEPHLLRAYIDGQLSDQSHTVRLIGSGLDTSVDVVYGALNPPDPTISCPKDDPNGLNGLGPDAGTCSYGVQQSDLSTYTPNLGPTGSNIDLPAPPGADLSRITIFSPGGWSNTISVPNIAAPMVTSISGAKNGSGDGTLYVRGTGLDQVTDILYGAPAPGELPSECPFSGNNPLPVQTSSCVRELRRGGLDSVANATFDTLYFPQGADLSHVVLLGPGGPSSVLTVNLPAAPVISGIQGIGTEPDGRPEVLITGQHLSNVSVVDFGSAVSPPSSTHVFSDAQLVTEVPSISGVVSVIANNTGGGSNPFPFTSPSLSAVSGASPQGSDPNPWISISGAGLTAAGPPQVFFGNIPSPHVTTSGGSVQAEVPDLVPGDPLYQYVVVRTPYGDTPDFGICPPAAGTSAPADCYAYPTSASGHAWPGEFGPPVLVATSAANAPLTGSSPTLTLSGSGFTGASQVQIGQAPLSACSGSGSCFKVVDDGTILVNAPSEPAGSYPVTVTVSSVGTSNSLNVAYAPAPLPPGGSVSPVNGPPKPTGPATSASGVTGNGPSFGPFTTNGNWTNNGHGVFTATGSITLNGLRLVPQGAGSISLDTNTGKLTATVGVDVQLAPVNVPGLGQVGPFDLYKYQTSFSWDLTQATIPLDLSGADIGGLSLGKLASLSPGSGSGSSSSGAPAGGMNISGAFPIPGILGGGLGKVTFRTTSLGIDPSSLAVSLGRVSIGGLITCDGCQLQFDPTNSGWFVSGNLSGPGGTQISGSITVIGGQVSAGTLRIQSTSLAGLVGVTNVEIDYASSTNGETWNGQATDTAGNQSTFVFTVTGGVLQKASVKVPKASIGGLLSISNLDFEYTSGSWTLASDAAVSGIANVSGNIAVVNGAVSSGSIHINSPALAALVQIPQIDLNYDGSKPGTDSWNGKAVDNSGNTYDFAFTFTDGALTSGNIDVPQASIAGVVALSGVHASFTSSQWSGKATVDIAGVGAGSIDIGVVYDPSGQLVKGHFSLTGGQLAGGIGIESMSIDYNDPSSAPTPAGCLQDGNLPGEFGGEIKVDLPGPAVQSVAGAVYFLNGSFHSACVSVGANIPIAPGVRLRQGSLAIGVDPLQLTGSLTVAAGPSFTTTSGKQVDSFDATGTISYSAAGLPTDRGSCTLPSAAVGITGNVGDWNVCATLTMLGQYQLAQADVNITSSGAVAFNGGLSLNIPVLWDSHAISFSAALDGYINKTGWGATAAAQLSIKGWTPQAAFAFSNKGMEACGDTGLHWPVINTEIMAGFKDLWGKAPSDWGSCNVGDVSASNIGSVRPLHANTVRAQLVANGPTFTAPGGQPMAVEVDGTGGAASFSLIAPDGTTVDIPNTTPSGTLVGNGQIFVLEDAANGSTFLLLASPAAGAWSISPDAGSVAIAQVQQGPVVPTPTVTGTVSGTAGARTLQWSATDQPGDQVVFRESGTGVVSQTLGTVTGTSGSIDFTPADGPGGTRTILAEVDRNGIPVTTATVATYQVADPVPPQAPTGGSAAPTGNGFSIGWNPPTYDGGSAVTQYVLTSNGQPVGSVPGGTSSATVQVAPGSTVQVAAVNSAGVGPSLSVNVVSFAGGVPVSGTTTTTSTTTSTTTPPGGGTQPSPPAPTPAPPTLSPTQAVVSALYQSLLGRGPDSNGLNTWSALLSSHHLTVVQLARAILGSDEYRRDLVIQDYLSSLHRAPDAGGLANDVAALGHGTTDEALLAALLASPEFYAGTGGTNTGYVKALYQDLLGRAADGAGLNHWVAALSGTLTRQQLASILLASTEYRSDLLRSDYRQLLERVPSPAEVASWLSFLAKGASDEEVLAGMAGSPEFAALAVRTDGGRFSLPSARPGQAF